MLQPLFFLLAIITHPLMKGVIFMLKQVFNMTEEEKQRFIEVTGKTILYLVERRSLFDMAKRLNLEPRQVNHNVDEMLYELRKSLGWKRYIKALFIK